MSPVPVGPAHKGFVLLETEPSVGRFPATLAVCRVSIADASTDERFAAYGEPYLAETPKNESLMWNSVFDDLLAVSEVFPIADWDLGGVDAKPAQILAAARALHARLVLLYGVNELSETEGEMLGVLFETAANKPIAVLHARAESLTLEDVEDPAVLSDKWKTDAKALVRRRFARFAHSCLQALILHDRRDTLDDRSGWVREDPCGPAVWPPGLEADGGQPTTRR